MKNFNSYGLIHEFMSTEIVEQSNGKQITLHVYRLKTKKEQQCGWTVMKHLPKPSHSIFFASYPPSFSVDDVIQRIQAKALKVGV